MPPEVNFRRSYIRSYTCKLHRFVVDFRKVAEEIALGLSTGSIESASNLHLQSSTVTAFEKFVLSLIGIARVLTLVNKHYAELRAEDDKERSKAFVRSLDQHERAVNQLCDDAHKTIARAKLDTMSAFQSRGLDGAMSLRPVKMAFVVAEILHNLQEKVFDVDHDIVTSYEVCAARIVSERLYADRW